MSDVTSSSGPMKLEDLQKILSNIGAGGMFFSDSAIDISLFVVLRLALVM
jgi:hypothetical protein